MFNFLNSTLGTTSAKPYVIATLRHALMVPTHVIQRFFLFPEPIHYSFK